MNKAVEFTRKVIMMAKEEGLACMVMAGGAYGFTGDLSQILGENNTSTGMIGETYYDVSKDTLKVVCFKDLLEFITNKAAVCKLIDQEQKTRIAADIGLNLCCDVSSDRQMISVWNRMQTGDAEIQFIMKIEFASDNSVWVYTSRDQETCYQFEQLDTMASKMKKKMARDMPVQIIQAVVEFLIQCMSV